MSKSVYRSVYCSVAALPLPLRVAVPFALPLALMPQVATQAVTFDFDFARPVPEEIRLATQEAADLWTPLLKDNAIVNLRIEYSDLSAAGSVLGGVQPGKVKVKYEDYADALFKDAISSNDFLGASNLQLSAKGREAIYDYQAGNLDPSKAKLESKEFTFLMDSRFARGNGKQKNRQSLQAGFLDANGNNNNKHVQLTRAQAKALDLLDYKSGQLDAVITVNSDAIWDFNRSDGIEANSYDAVTVLQHEIGHALGIVSGVDTMDFLASVGGPEDVEEIEKNKFSYLTPIDFYRYSEESAELGVMDLTIGGNAKYFSLDGGQSAVKDDLGRAAYFSTGSLESGGDGYQGSHWRASENPLGVMNPLLQPGKSVNISQLDLTLLDTVGWDLEDSVVERAAAVGISWSALTAQLSSDRQSVMKELLATWGDDIPELEAAVNDASSELEIKFQQKLQEKLDDLIDKFEKETDSGKRTKETAKFYEEVDKEAQKRNKELRKLPEDIYKTDEDVREWLTLSTDKLSKEMQKADATTINRLSNVVKALPADERAAVEAKIEAAVAPFADEPNKLVQELLDTSGPANPIGWNYLRWYWWWLEGEAIEDGADVDELDFEDVVESVDDDIDFYYFQQAIALPSGAAEDSLESLASFDSNMSSLANFDTANGSAKDVPEPSSILAIFGIAALGVKVLRVNR
ncbi:MAG: NF038122 family metalloprotease [Cyanobacteria bacterium J06627_28]